MRVMKYVTAIAAGLIVLSLATSAQVKNFVPVTTEMLRNPESRGLAHVQPHL